MWLFNTKRPIVMIVLINLLGFGLLSLTGARFDSEIFYSGIFISLILSFAYLVVNHLGGCDGYIFLFVSMLFSIGEIMLYRISPYFGQRQILWLLIGLCGFFIIYVFVLKLNIWEKISYGYYIFAVILFLVTLIFGVTISGSRNWIKIGEFTLQPSEIIKILVIFLLADRYNRPEKYRFKNIDEGIVSSVLVYSVIGFLVLQREWGTSVLLLLIHFSMMFIFGEKKRIMFYNILLGVVVGVIGCLFVSHIKVRINIWLDPWTDIMDKGYQITQSLFAITSGGFFGAGFGQGSPDYIPEVHSDFIFSAICEEFGIFGGIAIIMLYFLLVYRGIRISMQIPHKFYKAVAVGISAMFGFQSFIILGGVTKFIPLTGITLPFISYGGSSLIVCLGAIAVLEAVANRNYITAEEKDDE